MKYQYVNREISWLQFNERVLQEAADVSNPLQERIRFMGIFSNNQDEFFRVRVASLHRLVAINKKKYPERSRMHQATLDEIYRISCEQGDKVARIFKQIKCELENENVFVLDEKQINEKQGEFVRNYFQEHVRPQLFPIMLKQLSGIDYLKDRSIYLAVILYRNGAKPHLAMIKVPTSVLGRFLILEQEGDKKYVMFMDDVIRYCLDDIFDIFEYIAYDAYTFKFTRDAELDMDEDVSKSFLEIMSDSIRKRSIGSPVRFVYDRSMPDFLLNKLIEKISGNKSDHFIQGGRYHNYKDFFDFPNLLGDKFVYPKNNQVSHRLIAPRKSMFAAIKQQDILLHYPYHSFQHILDFLREASIDPKVRSIKMTLYRVASESAVVNALINAARNGKNVSVFLELQARFDEKQNIYLSEKLQNAGVKIIAAIPGFKVHSKLLIVRRKEEGRNVYYGYIGTGNFNESTSKFYTDEGLLTARTAINLEIRKVFELFEATYRQLRFRTLVVSPFSTRNFFMRMIEKEIANCAEGKEAWIRIKLNNLADFQMVNKLYKASQEGVKIEMIVRGICVLIPGVKDMSENIRVISIVDKFLEHSRVFAFANGGDPLVYMGSADWMARNLDSRVEVTTPILDKNIRQELLDILDIQLRDNVKARILDGSFENKFVENNKPEIRTQIEIYNYLKQKHNKNN